jgi:hypothetical protein
VLDLGGSQSLVVKLALISSGLGEGRQLGIEAKLCELADEAPSPHILGAAVEAVPRSLCVFDRAVDVARIEAAPAHAAFLGPR